MTTNTQLHNLRQNQRTLNLGLLWGGVMLIIVTLWVAVAHQDLPRFAVGLLGVMAVAVLAHVVAQLFTRGPAEEDRQLERLERQRRLVGKGLLAGGAVLILFAVWLAVAYGMSAFGDASALAVLSLIAAAAGCYQLTFSTQPVDQEQTFQRLAQRGLLSGVAGVFTGGKPTPNSVRVVVLIVGGVVGLLLTITAVLWAWIWRNDVFLAGLSAWRGPQAWKAWLCAYASLAGLAVMFAAAVFARPDLRMAPTFRRLLYGYNTVLMALLVFEFLVVLNIFVYVSYPMTFHWSESRGLYTLSDSAKDILQRLEQPTKAYVLLGETILEPDTRMLLDNARTITDKLEVEYVSPHRDFERVRDLQSRYPVLLGVSGSHGVLLVYGKEAKGLEDEPPPHSMIVAEKLGDRTESGGIRYKGEEAIMSELRFLSEGKKKTRIYFLQGNGELSLKRGIANRRPDLELSNLGMIALLDRLKKENYEVRGLSFESGKSDELMEYVGAGKNQAKEVPDDAQVVVIAGASKPLPKTTLDALSRYMKDRKGRLLVMLDLVVKVTSEKKIDGLVSSGVEELLEDFGIEATSEYVHRAPGPIVRERLMPRGDPTRVTASVVKSDTVLASKFLDQVFEMTSVRILQTKRNPNLQVTPLLEVAADPGREQVLIWPDNNYYGLFPHLAMGITRNQLESGEAMERSSKEPLPVAFTVSERNGTPRLLAIGDAEMISDPEMLKASTGSSQFNFMASALDWLADRPGIGIRPKEAGRFQYPLDVHPMRMVLLPAWAMMLGVVGLGIGVWVVRRR